MRKEWRANALNFSHRRHSNSAANYFYRPCRAVFSFLGGRGLAPATAFLGCMWKPEQRLLYSVNIKVIGYLQNVKSAYDQGVTLLVTLVTL
jgi:hypothetical protein